jgi:hypothetical protein
LPPAISLSKAFALTFIDVLFTKRFAVSFTTAKASGKIDLRTSWLYCIFHYLFGLFLRRVLLFDQYQ